MLGSGGGKIRSRPLSDVALAVPMIDGEGSDGSPEVVEQSIGLELKHRHRCFRGGPRSTTLDLRGRWEVSVTNANLLIIPHITFRKKEKKENRKKK